jgi:hypothetical protein
LLDLAHQGGRQGFEPPDEAPVVDRAVLATIAPGRLRRCTTYVTLLPEVAMPSKNPRVNTVLPPELYSAVARLAKQEGISLSHKVNDLVREALELEEDAGLDAIAKRRREARGRWVSQAEVKRRLGIS